MMKLLAILKTLFSGDLMTFANVTPAGPVIGSKVYFAEDGETVEAVTVSSTTAPAGTVLTTWRELGCVQSFAPQINRSGGTPNSCYSVTQGRYVKESTTGEQTDLRYEMTLKELDEFIVALSHSADGVDGSDEFVPAGADGKVRGYLLFDQYIAGTGNKIARVMAWVDLTVSSPPVASATGSSAGVMAEVIPNDNNIGTLTDVLAAA